MCGGSPMASSATEAPKVPDDHMRTINKLLAEFEAWTSLGEFEPLMSSISGGYSSSMYKLSLPDIVLKGVAFSKVANSVPQSIVARLYRAGSDLQSLQRPQRELAGMRIVSHIYVCNEESHLEEFIDGAATGTCGGPDAFTLSTEVTHGTVAVLAKFHRELTSKWSDHTGADRMSVDDAWASGQRILGPVPFESFLCIPQDESILPAAWRVPGAPRLDVPVDWAVDFMRIKAEDCAVVEGWTIEAVKRASVLFQACAKKCRGFPTALCHQDPHAANVMQWKDGSIMLVDLETINWNFAAFDVAFVVVRRGLESRGKDVVPDEAFMRGVVDAYLAENPIATPDEFLHQVRLCCVLAWWSKTLCSFIAFACGIGAGHPAHLCAGHPLVKAIPGELRGLCEYASGLL